MESVSEQGAAWSAAAHTRAELQEKMSQPLWEAMLASVTISPETELLDAGCGTGGMCILAARRGARVHGLDAAEGAIRVAHERLPSGDFRVEDIQALPYADAAFDAVLSANTVQFVSDPAMALRELRRVCRADGRVVVGIWGTTEENEYATVIRALVELLPSPLAIRLPWSLSAPGLLENIVTQARLCVIGQGAVDCPFDYPDDETFWRALGGSGVQQMVARVVGEERVRATMFDAVTPYRKHDGHIRMENRMRYIVSTP